MFQTWLLDLCLNSSFETWEIGFRKMFAEGDADGVNSSIISSLVQQKNSCAQYWTIEIGYTHLGDCVWKFHAKPLCYRLQVALSPLCKNSKSCAQEADIQLKATSKIVILPVMQQGLAESHLQVSMMPNITRNLRKCFQSTH